MVGVYNFSWWQSGPRLRLTALNLRTEDETYTGRGATQDDGRLIILLTNGAREMRMSGTLAKLKVRVAPYLNVVFNTRARRAPALSI